MSRPKNKKMLMLETIDVISLSNKFTLDQISKVFDCSTQFVRNCITRQEIRLQTERSQLNSSRGAWKDLKETELYQRLMLNG